LVARWEGQHWTTCKTASASGIEDVWVSPAGHVWVAGPELDEISTTAFTHCDP
jgi:hypothetical protein